MQNLGEILVAEGFEPERKLRVAPEQVPSVADGNPTSSKSVPMADPQNLETNLDDLLLADFDDSKGCYTAKALAEEFGLSSAGLRNVWLPHLVAAVGGDRHVDRLRRGKFTELARHLFGLYAHRPDEQTAEDWIDHIRARFAAEAEPEPVTEVLAVRSQLVDESENYHESQVEWLDEEMEATRNRSALMLQQLGALQQLDSDYDEISHAQQVQATREAAYAKRLELILAARQGEQQAIADTTVKRPSKGRADQHFQEKKLR